jgi:hypothetical protein
MAQLIKARNGAIINMDAIASIVHDESGFSSIHNHMKSVTIHMVGDASVTVLESDENYQLWLDFMSEVGSISDVMSSRHEECPEPDPWHHPPYNDMAEFE